jgi:hypothetical protein
MLLFKKRFLDAIRAGQKTQTIRLWPYRRMRAGQRSYIPGVGYIEVTAVDEVALEQLTDADAIPDGFPTAAELRAEIARIYADPANADQRAFRIVFRVLAPDEQLVARSERKRRKESRD